MKKNMDVVFLLDRSGSMGGMESDTIGGYNSYLKSLEKGTKVTTVLFDHEYEVLHDQKDVEEVEPLTRNNYYVRGCTALFDAIGKSIHLMDHKECEKVLFVITTDGLENSSREYSKKDIQKLIKKHSKWKFLYIGADIDSYKEGQDLGIMEENISNYAKDKKGIKTLFRSIAFASKMYDEDCFDASWKYELEDYIKENKED